MTEVGGDGEALAFLSPLGDAKAVVRARLRAGLLAEAVGAAVVEVDVVVLGCWVVAGFLAARFRLNLT